MHVCPICRGTGINLLTSEPCDVCRSYGVVVSLGNRCMACNGHGKQWNRPCNACRGSGYTIKEIVPFQEPPLRVGLGLIKQAFLALRAGFRVMKDEDGDYRIESGGNEVHPGALGILSGLLHWSAERTEQGAEPGRLIRDLLKLPDHAEVIVSPDGIWVHDGKRGAPLVQFLSEKGGQA